jgi:hypothetical protein
MGRILRISIVYSKKDMEFRYLVMTFEYQTTII